MTDTQYTVNEKRLSYVILSNGYKILLDGGEWIQQIEPYIPYKNLTYEECCLKQIQELTKDNENVDEVEALRNKLNELEEVVMVLSNSL